jgi:hypothetical protein
VGVRKAGVPTAAMSVVCDITRGCPGLRLAASIMATLGLFCNYIACVLNGRWDRTRMPRVPGR